MRGQRHGGGRGAGAGFGCGGGVRTRSGRGGGGMGVDGSCICPKCEKKFPHQQGVPCLKERCPDCGGALVREGSVHHQEITQRQDNSAG